MQEENFSPQESLQVIYSMIEKAKNQYSENGHLYLLWGWVVFFCSITQFILLVVFHNEKHYMVWFACWGALIYQFFYLRNKLRKKRVGTYADTAIGYVWLSFFILMILTGLLLSSQGIGEYYKLICPAFLALYGMPTFLSGILLRFRPLIMGGIGCWLLSVAAQFINYDYQLLLISGAMVIAWIIPGYLLRMRYKKLNA
jgi:FtsH-binding integral membrane protein